MVNFDEASFVVSSLSHSYRENLQMPEAYKARAQIAQETFRKK
jgi:hypothetical protein